MKRRNFHLLAVFFIFVFASCSSISYMTPDRADVRFPAAGGYKILGRVTIEVSQTEAGYNLLLEAAKSEFPGADDVVNIIIDEKVNMDVWLFILPYQSEHNYIMSGVVIDYLD